MYSTKDFPIREDYWYILCYHNFYNIHLVPYYFFDKAKAQIAIKRARNRYSGYQFEAIKGNKLRGHLLKYKINYDYFRKGRVSKYNYPPECKTRRQKKTYRDKYHKRLRKMGFIWYHAPIKFKVWQDSDILEIRPTKYRHRPRSNYRVFKVLSKPKYLYYLIDYPEIMVKDPNYVFKCRVIRWNVEKLRFKRTEVELLIHKLDTIIPITFNEAKLEILNTGIAGISTKHSKGLEKYYKPLMRFKYNEAICRLPEI